MEPEDRLEALLSARERRTPSAASSRDVTRDGTRGATPDEGLAPLLAAADRLSELRRAQPSPDFARALGEQLRARADQLRDVQIPSSEPRRAASRPSAVAAPATRHPAAPIPFAVRALRPALAAAAVLVLAFGVTTYAAAAQVGPGNPLYFVHRDFQTVQAQLASSAADRAQLHLEYAAEALQQLDAAARRHDDGAYDAALRSFGDELTAANQALASVPAGADHDTLAAKLADLQSQARGDLAAALADVDWNNRLGTTSALGALGVAVPHVTAAAVARSGQQSDGHDDGRSGTRGDVVTVSGSGFAPGAQLVVDGHTVPVATLTVTPTQIVAVVTDQGAEQSVERARAIGVGNPDGAAAQTTHIAVQGSSDNGGSGNGSGSGGDKHPGTPTPNPTGTPDHGHGGHGP